MKTKLILILFALLANVDFCLADDDNGLPIDIEPNTGLPTGPHRSPAYPDIYGVFNTITQTLTLTVNTEDVIEEINIYRNGVQIIADVNPVMTVYNLAAYGNGTFLVEVTTESGDTYIGSFSY